MFLLAAIENDSVSWPFAIRAFRQNLLHAATVSSPMLQVGFQSLARGIISKVSLSRNSTEPPYPATVWR